MHQAHQCYTLMEARLLAQTLFFSPHQHIDPFSGPLRLLYRCRS